MRPIILEYALREKSTILGIILLILALVLLPAEFAESQTETLVSEELVASDSLVLQEAKILINPRAYDTPNDNGGSITIEWKLAELEGLQIERYEIFRSTDLEGDFLKVGETTSRVFVDTKAHDDSTYYYRIVAFSDAGDVAGALTGPVRSSKQWFDKRRINLLIISIVLVAVISYFMYLGAIGKDLYIRKIAGLEAIDEAVGRATEMGRSILFIPGIQDMDNVQTVAGMTILAEIAKKTATYETRLEVPVSRSIVMSVGRETIRQAYLEAGRPDLYNDDMVYYVTDEQFGYVAAVDGVMVRQQPAACFYLGAFFAESLILAETGNSIGAIQIAGTAMPTQLPFFVASCDYTLIGEELFAASAYLSKDRKMQGSLKGQDAGKAIAMFFIVVGVVVATIALVTGNERFLWLSDWMKRFFSTAW
ncbi:MAG: DUF6754 domain-containing protein [bacterium]